MIFSTWREGWKVVKEVRRRGQSVFVSCRAGSWKDSGGVQLFYYFKKPTFPYGRRSSARRHGPCAVFVSLEAAQEFVRRFNSDMCLRDKIVRCLYAPSADRALWKVNGGIREEFLTVPPGTDFADAVVLLEEVN